MSESEETPKGYPQETVEIFLPPSYEYNLGAFDNEETSPNLTFMIQGLEKPLKLHKDTLCQVSKFIERVLKEKEKKVKMIARLYGCLIQQKKWIKKFL